jgi:hypothetical protein
MCRRAKHGWDPMFGQTSPAAAAALDAAAAAPSPCLPPPCPISTSHLPCSHVQASKARLDPILGHASPAAAAPAAAAAAPSPCLPPPVQSPSLTFPVPMYRRAKHGWDPMFGQASPAAAAAALAAARDKVAELAAKGRHAVAKVGGGWVRMIKGGPGAGREGEALLLLLLRLLLRLPWLLPSGLLRSSAVVRMGWEGVGVCGGVAGGGRGGWCQQWWRVSAAQPMCEAGCVKEGGGPALLLPWMLLVTRLRSSGPWGAMQWPRWVGKEGVGGGRGMAEAGVNRGGGCLLRPCVRHDVWEGGWRPAVWG